MKKKHIPFYIIILSCILTIINASQDMILDYDKAFEETIKKNAKKQINSPIKEIQQNGHQSLYHLAILRKLELPVSTFSLSWIEALLRTYALDDDENIKETEINELDQNFNSFIQSNYQDVFSSLKLQQFLGLYKNVLLHRTMILKKLNLPIQKTFLNWITTQFDSLKTDDQKILEQNFNLFCMAQQKGKTLTAVPEQILKLLEEQKNKTLDTGYIVLSGLYDQDGHDLFEEFNKQLREITAPQESIAYSMPLSAAAYTLAIPKLKGFKDNKFDIVSFYKTFLNIYKKLSLIVEHKKNLSMQDFNITTPNKKALPRDQIEFILYQATKLDYIKSDTVLAANPKNPKTIDTIFEPILKPAFIIHCAQNHHALNNYFELKGSLELQKKELQKQESNERNILAKAIQEYTEQIKTDIQQVALKELEIPEEKSTKASRKNPSNKTDKVLPIVVSNTSEKKTGYKKDIVSKKSKTRALRHFLHETYLLLKETEEKDSPNISKKQLKKQRAQSKKEELEKKKEAEAIATKTSLPTAEKSFFQQLQTIMQKYHQLDTMVRREENLLAQQSDEETTSSIHEPILSSFSEESSTISSQDKTPLPATTDNTIIHTRRHNPYAIDVLGMPLPAIDNTRQRHNSYTEHLLDMHQQNQILETNSRDFAEWYQQLVYTFAQRSNQLKFEANQSYATNPELAISLQEEADANYMRAIHLQEEIFTLLNPQIDLSRLQQYRDVTAQDIPQGFLPCMDAVGAYNN